MGVPWHDEPAQRLTRMGCTVLTNASKLFVSAGAAAGSKPGCEPAPERQRPRDTLCSSSTEPSRL
jgi:hypothetical protein